MRLVAFDTETRNRRGIRAAGTYHYAETAECISMHVFEYPSRERMRWDILGKGSKGEIRRVLNEAEFIIAHNAMFDRTVAVEALGWTELANPWKWVCTAALARYCGLPGALGDACKAVKLHSNWSKMDDSGGIRTFCTPGRDGETFTAPEEDPERWANFMEYGDRDAEACMRLFYRLRQLMPREAGDYWREHESKVFHLDQCINETGFAVDREAIRSASAMVDTLKVQFDRDVAELTGGAITKLQSPKLREWLNEHEGLELENLQAGTVKRELESNESLSERAIDLLTLRQQGAKNSLAKYKAMDAMVSDEDDRVRAGYLYHGAHTGRWAGQSCQPQNLARPVDGLDPPEVATIVGMCDGNADTLRLFYTQPVFDVLMSGIRGALCPGRNRVLVIGDYSNIEARITAWYAGAQDRLDAIAEHDAWIRAGRPGEKVLDLYELTARDVLGSADKRQAGKMLELGLGFGMGARKFGLINKLDPDVAEEWVAAWRERNPRIPMFWRTLHSMLCWFGDIRGMFDRINWCRETWGDWPPVMRKGFQRRVEAIQTVYPRLDTLGLRVGGQRGVEALLWLPNGKMLRYHKAMNPTMQQAADEAVRLGWRTEDEVAEEMSLSEFHANKPGPWSFAFVPPNRGWTIVHPGFTVENAVQATARELEAEHMRQMSDDGLTIVNHSHDEIVVECKAEDAEAVRAQMTDSMERRPSWMPDVPLRAEVSISERYTK